MRGVNLNWSIMKKTRNRHVSNLSLEATTKLTMARRKIVKASSHFTIQWHCYSFLALCLILLSQTDYDIFWKCRKHLFEILHVNETFELPGGIVKVQVKGMQIVTLWDQHKLLSYFVYTVLLMLVNKRWTVWI